MKNKIKNILIILLKVDYWTYFLTLVSVILFFLLLDENQFLMTSLIINVILLRKILVYYLKTMGNSQ
jgi:hypothetical protein